MHFNGVVLFVRMSFVHVLIIKNGRVGYHVLHWRSAKERLLKLPCSRSLDAGFLVVDSDRKQIINAQSAFDVRKLARDFDLFEG